MNGDTLTLAAIAALALAGAATRRGSRAVDARMIREHRDLADASARFYLRNMLDGYYGFDLRERFARDLPLATGGEIYAIKRVAKQIFKAIERGDSRTEAIASGTAEYRRLLRKWNAEYPNVSYPEDRSALPVYRELLLAAYFRTNDRRDPSDAVLPAHHRANRGRDPTHRDGIPIAVLTPDDKPGSGRGVECSLLWPFTSPRTTRTGWWLPPSGSW